MFDENFSFDTPRSPSLDSTNTISTRETSRSVSPCSVVTPYPPPRLSVTDLACQLAGQRLQRDSLICYDPCESYANLDDEAGWQIDAQRCDDNDELAPVRRSRTFPPRPTRPHSPSQRSQRQLNTQLLCSSTHQRDMAALVSRMVESSDQCSVLAPDTLSISVCNQEDEGYDSGEGSPPMQSRRTSVASSRPKLSYRRSSDMKSTGACVSKNARLRKDRSQHLRIRSMEKTQ